MDEKIYQGSCHCGAVEYDVAMALDGLINCNCSICQRKGSILGFVPAEKFTLKKGADNLSDYQFGEKRIHHLFCKTCGVSSFSSGTGPDGSDVRAINARCLDGVDIDALDVKKFDGRSM